MAQDAGKAMCVEAGRGPGKGLVIDGRRRGLIEPHAVKGSPEKVDAK
jgi:hypothetical protein